MERIRKRVTEAVFADAQKYGIDLSQTPVTMTFGVVEQKAGDALASIDSLIDRADQHLYQGKRNGRNQIVG